MTDRPPGERPRSHRASAPPRRRIRPTAALMACVTLAAAGGFALIVANACAPACSAQALIRSGTEPTDAAGSPATPADPAAPAAASPSAEGRSGPHATMGETATPPAATAGGAPAGGATDGTPAAPPNASLDQLLKRVDQQRVRAGCQTWTRSTVLDRAAQAQATVVAGGGVSHVDGTGGTALDRARRQGYQGNVVEIVAQGALDPDEFMTAFVRIANQSDVLNCRFRTVGAAESRRHLVIVLGDR